MSNRCTTEGCDKFTLLGKDYCWEHNPDKPAAPTEVEIPDRLLNPDPEPEHWQRYTLPTGDSDIVQNTSYLECPYCCAMVHEDSAMWHSKWHQSMNANFRAIYQGIESASYSK